VKEKPETDWDRGHFWENGAAPLIAKLATYTCEPKRYAKGMATFFGMLHQGGVTTCLDMGIGVFGDPSGEADLILKTAEAIEAPCRAILTPTEFDFLTRGLKPAQAFEEAEEWARKYKSRRVFLDRHFKLQVDGAIFGGLSQYGFPGYLDGHDGMWMAPPELFLQYAEPFWKAGYQIHAHINGDLSADLFIDIIRRLQDIKPRFGHRATLEHFAFTSEDQCRQMQEVGIVVSANPYYHYILSDIFSDEWLGPDRGRYLTRFGTLERFGVPFAFHSDCPMAPLSPLLLAWTAVNRRTINGNLNGPEERASLDAALRAITIDAAWIIRRENDIGSIRAGKLADFAVLEEDPYEVGAEGLKDIPIWGTVFEGEVHPIKK
jgi:predicted amidohydrolase YtcJ